MILVTWENYNALQVGTYWYFSKLVWDVLQRERTLLDSGMSVQLEQWPSNLLSPTSLRTRPHLSSLLPLPHFSLLHHQLIIWLRVLSQSKSESLTQGQLPFPTTTVQPPHTPVPELPSLPLIGMNGPYPTQELPSRSYKSLCLFINSFPSCLDYSLQWPFISLIARCPFPHLHFPSTAREWSVSTASTSSPPTLAPIHSSQGWSLPLPSIKDTNILQVTKLKSRQHWHNWLLPDSQNIVLHLAPILSLLSLIGCCFSVTLARPPSPSSSAEL